MPSSKGSSWRKRFLKIFTHWWLRVPPLFFNGKKKFFFDFFFVSWSIAQERLYRLPFWSAQSDLPFSRFSNFSAMHCSRSINFLIWWKKIENTNFFFSVRYQTNWKQVEIYDLLSSTNAHVVSRHLTITTGRTTKNLFVLWTSTYRGIFTDWYLSKTSKEIICPLVRTIHWFHPHLSIWSWLVW